MPIANVQGTEIYYEVIGSPDDPAVLLISGFKAQLTSFRTEFCELLAAKGLRVVRFDNRDSGLSSKTDAPMPALIPKADLQAPGPEFSLLEATPYSLADMAADSLGVLDDLGIGRAHIVGVSMGGILGQVLASTHGDRVLSLASIMSTTGDPTVGGAEPHAAAAVFEYVPPEREAEIEHGVKTRRVVAGPHFDEPVARAESAEAFDRSFFPQGGVFQVAAVMAAGDRTTDLSKVTCPTVVIHGAGDPLVSVTGGRATAAAIDGADLVVIDDMGHDLSKPLWPRIVDAVWANMQRAGG